MIGKEEIARLVPHDGDMCLLDGVTFWDENAIHCISATHRNLNNPLRHRGGLSAICGVEYAVQAMAIHGRLAGAVGQRPSKGYLASIRETVCHVARLDLLAGDLAVKAERLFGDEERVIYRFSVLCDDAVLVSGRVAVVLQADSP